MSVVGFSKSQILFFPKQENLMAKCAFAWTYAMVVPYVHVNSEVLSVWGKKASWKATSVEMGCNVEVSCGAVWPSQTSQREKINKTLMLNADAEAGVLQPNF
jgi:hypothetical protein